jgi:5-hydroxyisourate hydrolase-like protein (transthyretin family)
MSCRLATGGLLCAVLLCAQNKPLERCYVSGVVVDAATGQPLAKAQVRLERRPRDGPDSGTATNTEGKFAMAAIEPGTYRLRAFRNGYQGMYLGARRSDSTGTTLVLAPGQEVTGLKIALQPYAVIAGTIRDSDGEALVGTTVQAFRWHFMGSKRRLLSESSTRTDDLGQYRMPDLRPGKYLLRVDPRPNTDIIDRSADEKRRPEFDAATYYPGVADWTAAVPLELTVGARLNGVDVLVRRSRMFQIAGQVITASGVDGRPKEVRLRDAKSENLFGGPEAGAQVMSDGSFLFRNVVPGSYRLRAYVEAESRVWVGSTLLDVRDTDVEGVEVAIRSGTEVSGRLRPEDESDEPIDNWVVIFESGDDSVVGRAKYPERTFSVSLAPGHYTIQLSRGKALSHAWLGARDILAEGLTVGDSGKLQLDLVASVGAGQIAGAAVTATGEPATSTTVVLIPEPKFRDQMERFQDVATDQYGRFLLKDIPPGQYQVFAWDDVEEGSWFDPDFLKKYEKAGEAVTVKAKQTENVKITAR